jgi:tetratricopeptide (TPR) repeat protein
MTFMPALTWIARIALVAGGLMLAALAGAQSDDYAEAGKLFRSGQQAQALERVDTFLKANPKDARGRFLKGVILSEQSKQAEIAKQPDAAASKLNDAVKIFVGLTEEYPEMPEPYNNLAVLYASQGQYDKARTALEMAIRTNPIFATAYDNLGDVYAKMASQAYDKALQLDKTNAVTQTKLEMIKELFSSGTRATGKPAAGKTASTVVAAVTKPAPVATTPAPTATTVTPAPPVAPTTPAAKTAAATDSEVLKTVNGWAKAWSDNDVQGYLSYYAPDFQTPGDEPRADWEAARKARIAKPKKIDVRVEAPKVKFTDNNTRVSVTFRQNYRSSNLKVASTKTLVLVRTGDRWLIQQERVGS